MPDIPDSEFLANSPASGSSKDVLAIRGRIARILGIPPSKIAADYTATFLSERIGYLAEFSVAWNDLLYEAMEAREAAGLGERDFEPTTISEIVEDLLLRIEVPSQ